AAPFAAGRCPSRRRVQRGADEPHRHTLPLPSVLRFHFTLADGPTTTAAAGSPDEIAKLFPNLYGQPSAEPVTSKLLKISVVPSGGQALGGQNVICDVFDYPRERAKGSTCMDSAEARLVS
uniref:Uncharacterized protein n=1 Tax=Triticum urartu TaxID=4572 RepID=A0A8R7QTH2_TRIUA